MNRAERLHALTEQIRRHAPAPLSAAWLADRFAVSRRTIERDLAALRRAGIPLHTVPGRRGGHLLHPRAVLPPANLTPTEVTALLIAVTYSDGMPYTGAARSAATKLQALLPPTTAAGVETLRQRVRIEPTPQRSLRRVVDVLEQAILDNTVVRLAYTDRHGNPSRRDVEPAGFYGTTTGWSLAAWCRTRDAGRLFRLDRITAAHPTREPHRYRDLDTTLGWLPAPTITPE